MHNLLLKDFLAGRNLMGLISNDFPLSAIIDTTLLNDMLIIEYGNKIVATNFATVSIESLAKIIVASYKPKWTALFNTLDQQINILLDSTETTTENVRDNGTTTDDGNSIDKVSAFNSESLIENTGSDTTNLHTSSGNRDRMVTVTNGNLNNALNNLQIVQDLNIIEHILLDTVNYFTLSIYKEC